MAKTVLLLGVPIDNPVYMPTGLAYLTGYLRDQSAKGRLGDVRVIQRDLNPDFFEEIIGSRLLQSMRSVRALRNFPKHLKNRELITSKVRKATDGLVSVERNTFTYTPHENYKTRAGILDAVRKRTENLFYDFFVRHALPLVKETSSGIVGITVRDQKQYLTGFILAAAIKDFCPDVRVVLGGNMITRNYDVLAADDRENRELFRYVDGMIHHEGEIAFAEYVRYMTGLGRLQEVPKLIYKTGNSIQENLEFPVVDMDELPPPDYSDFIAQGNYWTPRPVIPYVIGRGCYWGRCAFCDIPVGYDHSIDRMDDELEKKHQITGTTRSSRRKRCFEKVVEDLRYLRATHNTTYFSFGDEELDCELLDRFSEFVSGNGGSLDYECYSRLEAIYATHGTDFCSGLRESGCRFLQFGLESVSEEVLKLNAKSPDVYSPSFLGRIFRNTYNAGIMNHAFILVGLPGDSLIEAAKIVPFLETYGEYLTTIKPIYHKISKWSPIGLSPEEYGVVLDKPGTGDLEVNIHLRKKPQESDKSKESEESKKPRVMSRKKAEAFVRFLDLWIRRRHKVNVATSQYIYAQRLFLTRDELEEIGRAYRQSDMIDEQDGAYLRRVYSGLVGEIKELAYNREEKVSSEKRRAFEKLYRQRKHRDCQTFEDVLEFVRDVARI